MSESAPPIINNPNQLDAAARADIANFDFGSFQPGGANYSGNLENVGPVPEYNGVGASANNTEFIGNAAPAASLPTIEETQAKHAADPLGLKSMNEFAGVPSSQSSGVESVTDMINNYQSRSSEVDYGGSNLVEELAPLNAAGKAELTQVIPNESLKPRKLEQARRLGNITLKVVMRANEFFSANTQPGERYSGHHAQLAEAQRAIAQVDHADSDKLRDQLQKH